MSCASSPTTSLSLRSFSSVGSSCCGTVEAVHDLRCCCFEPMALFFAPLVLLLVFIRERSLFCCLVRCGCINEKERKRDCWLEQSNSKLLLIGCLSVKILVYPIYCECQLRSYISVATSATYTTTRLAQGASFFKPCPPNTEGGGRKTTQMKMK